MLPTERREGEGEGEKERERERGGGGRGGILISARRQLMKTSSLRAEVRKKKDEKEGGSFQ